MLVMGATGYTGRLVCDELDHRRIPYIIAGRDLAALERMAGELRFVRGLRKWDPARRDAPAGFLEHVGVVINCAGPFIHIGEWVVEAAVAGRVHYVDSSGEQPFLSRVWARYHRDAQAAGVTMVNALAYEFAMGDLGSKWLCDAVPGIDTVHILYASKSAYVSSGTKKSALGVLARGGRGFEDGKRVPMRIGTHQRQFSDSDRVLHGLSIPGGEAISVPRHSPGIRTIRTYMPFSPSAARRLPWVSKIAPLLLRPSAVQFIERWIDRKSPPRPTERPKGSCRVILEGESDGNIARRIDLVGPDPYDLTAAALVEGAVTLQEGAALPGVRAPGELFQSMRFLRAVGVQVIDDSR